MTRCEIGRDGICKNCLERARNRYAVRYCARSSKPIQINSFRRADVLFTREVGMRSWSGPGTELSKLLKRFGIEPTPTCQCRAKAAEMDAWGCDECSKPERIEEVVRVMRDEAKARGLPFVDIAARLLVTRAIHNARKAEARRAKEAAKAQSGESLAAV